MEFKWLASMVVVVFAYSPYVASAQELGAAYPFNPQYAYKISRPLLNRRMETDRAPVAIKPVQPLPSARVVAVPVAPTTIAVPTYVTINIDPARQREYALRQSSSMQWQTPASPKTPTTGFTPANATSKSASYQVETVETYRPERLRRYR